MQTFHRKQYNVFFFVLYVWYSIMLKLLMVFLLSFFEQFKMLSGKINYFLYNFFSSFWKFNGILTTTSTKHKYNSHYEMTMQMWTIFQKNTKKIKLKLHKKLIRKILVFFVAGGKLRQEVRKQNARKQESKKKELVVLCEILEPNKESIKEMVYCKEKMKNFVVKYKIYIFSYQIN